MRCSAIKFWVTYKITIPWLLIENTNSNERDNFFVDSNVYKFMKK
jgi:hypothetical protein